MDYFIQMLLDVAPRENTIPKNYYEERKVVSTIGLKAVKIDCCQVDCMLYYKEDIDLNECKFCGLLRYLPMKSQNKRYKRVPVKRMFYLPIIPRLQRLYASIESARHMRWHYENKTHDNALRHPSDGKAWKHFDNVYTDFVADPHYVGLGLCFDGYVSRVSWWDFPCFSLFLQFIFLYPIFIHPLLQSVSIHPLLQSVFVHPLFLDPPAFSLCLHSLHFITPPLPYSSPIPHPISYATTSYPPFPCTFGPMVQSSSNPYLSMTVPLHQTLSEQCSPRLTLLFIPSLQIFHTTL